MVEMRLFQDSCDRPKLDEYGCPVHNTREENLKNELINIAIWWVLQLDGSHDNVKGASYRELQARVEMARLARELREYL